MLTLIIHIAFAHGIDPELLHAVLWVESSMKHSSISHTGDVGIAQISPHLAKAYKWDRSRLQYDMAYNIDCAAQYLEDLKKQYGKKEPRTWYTRYHSRNLTLRFKYKMRLSKYLP